MDGLIQRFSPLWGKWAANAFLGAGSFGKVWKISAPDESQPAAVKEVRIPFSDRDLSAAAGEGLDIPGAKHYFHALLDETLKEAELMRDLAFCETVVHIDDCQVKELDREGEFGWVVFIRMEYLMPFRDLLIQGLSALEIAKLGIDLSHALEACEEKGIVHRDVKPDNLFFSPESGRYKLGDFGIAHYLARPTEGKGRAGTLTHMPPEVYQGAPFTTGADLYALGMILYRLLNHNRIPLLPPFPIPFTPMERDRALVQRLKGARIPAPGAARTGLAAQLGEIARKAVAASPDDRFASPGELREAIQKSLYGEEGNHAGKFITHI